jgi:hypothetical protein
MARKKAVNNIQKALTKKILTRLDDSQPLVNVFSKMQSLSKMMPQIQDFERRLGILHQVEPILENAINTLSKVVDLNSALPALKPTPKPKPAAPASPDLGTLKAMLANAQKKKQAEAEVEEEDPMAALLGGGGGGDISELLGGGGGGADLSALLGGGAAAEPEAEAPAAEPEATPESAEEDALAALTGGAAAGGGTEALLSKLLGAGLVQIDSDIQMDAPLSSAIKK